MDEYTYMFLRRPGSFLSKREFPKGTVQSHSISSINQKDLSIFFKWIVFIAYNREI